MTGTSEAPSFPSEAGPVDRADVDRGWSVVGALAALRRDSPQPVATPGGTRAAHGDVLASPRRVSSWSSSSSTTDSRRSGS